MFFNDLCKKKNEKKQNFKKNIPLSLLSFWLLMLCVVDKKYNK